MRKRVSQEMRSTVSQDDLRALLFSTSKSSVFVIMSTSQGESSLPVKSLLDLPVEIQTQIYHQYYAKPWTFYAQDYHFNAIQPRGQHPNPFMTNPSINLLLTCRAINEIASPVLPASYKNIVSLVAVEKFNEYREWDVFLSTCQKFLAPATIFHIRLDQAEHFSGWDLIHKLQDMEAQNFKTVVMEDHFVVKKKRSVFGRHDKGQMRRIPFSFIERVVEGRYMTAEPWGMDTWRRDYNSHHLLYPIHHRYLLRFRVDQSALCNKIFVRLLPTVYKLIQQLHQTD